MIFRNLLYRLKDIEASFKGDFKSTLSIRPAAARALPKPARLVGVRLLVLSVLASLTLVLPARAADRSVHTYSIPNSVLQRADGSGLRLEAALSDGRPVVLTFMFSSCQTVCPINNQVLVELEQLLGAQRERVNLVSISIDPDHDSVQRLAAYAKRTGHKGSFFTGDPGSSEAVQRAFDSWRGDKQNHEPVFFLRRASAGQAPWVRLSGFVTPSELLGELHALAPELRLPPVKRQGLAERPGELRPQPVSISPSRRVQ